MVRGRKQLESPSGNGKIYLADDHIADAQYGLLIRREVNVKRSFAGRDEFLAYEVISGHVRVLGSKRNLLDREIYTLILEDGRTVDFFASSGNFVDATYRICPAGANGLPRYKLSHSNAPV